MSVQNLTAIHAKIAHANNAEFPIRKKEEFLVKMSLSSFHLERQLEQREREKK